MAYRMLLLLISGIMTFGLSAGAQERFDNGRVSFTVPAGWHTETSSRHPGGVLLKANKGVAFIAVVFEKALPRNLQQLAPAAEQVALREASAMFSATTGMRLTGSCGRMQRGDLNGVPSVSCFDELRDRDGVPAFLYSFGVPLRDDICVIAEFFAGDQQDAESVREADEVLQASISFLLGGNGGDTTSVAGSLDKVYRSDVNRATFTPPPGWRQVQADPSSFMYQNGDMTYAVYFGSFSALYYTVGASGSPWNIHQGIAHDHFLADAGNWRMEARGTDGFVEIIASPVSEFPQAQALLQTMQNSLKRDSVSSPSFATARDNSSPNTSASPSSAGCSGCAQMMTNYMNNMTKITSSGW